MDNSTYDVLPDTNYVFTGEGVCTCSTKTFNLELTFTCAMQGPTSFVTTQGNFEVVETNDLLYAARKRNITGRA
jgi:hypothetical protein